MINIKKSFLNYITFDLWNSTPNNRYTPLAVTPVDCKPRRLGQ